MLTYISTRGDAPELTFEEVLLAGLASDGGLYVPKTVPRFSPAKIASLARLPYTELAFEVMWPFVEGSLPERDFRRLITEAYQDFRHPAIAPLWQLGHNEWVMDLHFGPTLAFKDFALQLLGRLLDYVLQRRGEKIVIVGATSGDTGSAAIAGCRGRRNMDIYILHPHGRVSEVQRRQMTTVLEDNVHNLAIEGTFDDCQDIVKALFNDAAFRKQHHLVAVNSINWARILAQVVYYFHAALALGAPSRKVSFSVPTGNFGDIYAGYVAKQMGLPVGQLIIATNRNDILTRCLEQGAYTMEGVVPTVTPSMDIQISSNFERLLFDLFDRDGHRLAQVMRDFRTSGTLPLSVAQLQRLKRDFAAGRLQDEEILTTVKQVLETTGQLIDPHTAVGVGVGRACHHKVTDAASLAEDTPLVVLATAHPAKFPASVEKATGLHPALPLWLSDIMVKEERCDILPAHENEVKSFINKHQA
jgi:threonine synthase